MTTSEIIGALVGGGGLFLTVIGMAIKTTRAISKAETEIRSDMDAQVENLQRDVSRLEREDMARGDTYRQEFGETAAAIRTKIHEVEVFSRDHFISKDTFASTIGRFEKALDNLGDRIEKRFDKFAERIDKMND